jgi:hypothetical protein
MEAWRSLQLNIQVRFSPFHPHKCPGDSKPFGQPESVHTIQDSLKQVSQPQPVQVGQSSSSEASKQVLLEALPPVLVLHLGRFPYDATADGMVKIRKSVQFAPELEIPSGTGFPFLSPRAGQR